MRLSSSLLGLLLLPALLAGCAPQGSAGGVRAFAVPVLVEGWDSYGHTSRPIVCGERPVLLTGSHTDLTLAGSCRYVRLAGAHNDVSLPLAPGGTIEITGAHNDVFWRPLGDASVRPALLDRGFSNTFHRRAEGG